MIYLVRNARPGPLALLDLPPEASEEWAEAGLPVLSKSSLSVLLSCQLLKPGTREEGGGAEQKRIPGEERF